VKLIYLTNTAKNYFHSQIRKKEKY